MTAAEVLRSYFLGLYAIGVLITVIAVVVDYVRSAPVERRPEGAGRHLLATLVPSATLLPLLLILLRVGEIDAEWVPVRLLGFALSLYAAAMELWVALTLGRFLVPQAVVFEGHRLATSGPYRLLRHPDYSAILALWLGAALGTLNGGLLLLFPLAVLGWWTEARLEEQLLEAKFGEAYRVYSCSRLRFIPRLLED